jgi:hypothetical protein
MESRETNVQPYENEPAEINNIAETAIIPRERWSTNFDLRLSFSYHRLTAWAPLPPVLNQDRVAARLQQACPKVPLEDRVILRPLAA